MDNHFDAESLLSRWRDRIGGLRRAVSRRPLAALGYLISPGRQAAGLLDLRDLVLVLLYDEPIGRRSPALRFVGYSGHEVPHGVLWGGRDNCRFYKDLRVEPASGGSGLALDLRRPALLQLALRLCTDLHAIDRFRPNRALVAPRLPRLWAGFAGSYAASLCGDGPEFTALCQKFDLAPEAMFAKFKREHQGLACFPLDWVSDKLRHSLGVFVDLGRVPRRQVFRLDSLPNDLQGFQGAAEFDFYHSRQREHFEQRLSMRRRKKLAAVPRIGTRNAVPKLMEAVLSL